MSERFRRITTVVLLLVALTVGALYSGYRVIISGPYAWDGSVTLQSWWEIPELVCGLAAYFVAAIGWAIITTHRPWWRVPVATGIALAAAAVSVYCFYRATTTGPTRGLSPWNVPGLAGAIVACLIVRSWWTGGLN